MGRILAVHRVGRDGILLHFVRQNPPSFPEEIERQNLRGRIDQIALTKTKNGTVSRAEHPSAKP